MYLVRRRDPAVPVPSLALARAAATSRRAAFHALSVAAVAERAGDYRSAVVARFAAARAFRAAVESSDAV